MKRKHVKTVVGIFVLCMALLLSACGGNASQTAQDTSVSADASATTSGAASEAADASGEQTDGSEKFIAGEDFDPEAGADAYANSGDNRESLYFKNPDFYNLKNSDTLTIIENFKTMQQTTEWSCGNVTALMVLENLGLNRKSPLSEMDIAIGMKSHSDRDVEGSAPGSADNYGEFGTNVEQMVQFFTGMDGVKIVETSYRAEITEDDLYKEGDPVPESDFGNLKRVFHSASLYASENDPETEKYVEDAKDSYFVQWLTGHLKAGRAIMVEWVDWNGHWQAIVGYDNNGTPSIGDDILIFADPYDTGDHAQDGFYVYPLERWFYMWHDRSVAPKPFQLQPYIIIDRADR